jgi:hypothetical protein
VLYYTIKNRRKQAERKDVSVEFVKKGVSSSFKFKSNQTRAWRQPALWSERKREKKHLSLPLKKSRIDTLLDTFRALVYKDKCERPRCGKRGTASQNTRRKEKKRGRRENTH